MKLYVIMDDDYQEACPVEADNPDEAREKAEAICGRDLSQWPVYCADDFADMEQIIATIAGRKHK